MEGDRLALSVTTNTGRVVRWGGDEPDAERIPGDLEFSTSMPGGYRDLSCSLLRRLSGDERLFNDVRAYGPGNRTAWNGRLAQFPREDLQVNPGAVGWSAHLRDDPSFREIYVDRDLSRWTGPSVQRQLNLLSTWDPSFDASVVPDSTSGSPSLKTSLQGDWANRTPICETINDTGKIPLGSMYYAWKIGSSVNAADPNWAWSAILGADDVFSSFDTNGNLRAAGPSTGTLTATTSTRMVALLQQGYTAIPSIDHQSTEYPVFWTVLALYGRHGLTKVGAASATDAQGFYGHDLIANIVSRTAPLLTATQGSGGIEPNTGFVVPQAAFVEPTTGEEAIMLLNGYFLWEWGVYDNRRFFWRAPDPNRLVWQARKDQGAHLSEEGETAEAQFNGVMVRYTDPSGQHRTAGPPATYWQGAIARCDVTDANLVDASPENAVNAAGIPRRWGVLDVTPVTTDIGAVQLGVVWLAEHRLPQRRGTITVANTVTHPTEGPVPTWRVRAGDGVVVPDRTDDLPRRIIQTSYNRGNDTNTLTVGNTEFKLDALLERIGISLVGVL